MYAIHKQVVVFQLWNPCEAGKNFKIYPQNSDRGMRSFHFIVSGQKARWEPAPTIMFYFAFLMKKIKDLKSWASVIVLLVFKKFCVFPSYYILWRLFHNFFFNWVRQRATKKNRKMLVCVFTLEIFWGNIRLNSSYVSNYFGLERQVAAASHDASRHNSKCSLCLTPRLKGMQI